MVATRSQQLVLNRESEPVTPFPRHMQCMAQEKSWYLLSFFLSDGSSPGFFSGPAVKAKYNAWQSAGQRYGEDASAAKTRYIEIAYDIGWRPDSDSAGEDQVKGKKTGLGGVRVSAMSPDDQAEDGETL